MGKGKRVNIYDFDSKRFWRVPMSVMSTKAWREWIGTSEAKVWSRLYENAIRDKMESPLGNMIYEKYYKKGLVCAHWRQEEIANDIGIKSKSAVSEVLSSMAKKGIIKKHKERWNNNNIVVYEMGTHDKTVSKNENYHLYTYAIKEEINRNVNKSDELRTIDDYR